jgi:hypothetical protein
VREKVMLDVARRFGDSLSPSLPKQRPSSISTHIVSRNLTRFFKGPKIEEIAFSRIPRPNCLAGKKIYVDEKKMRVIDCLGLCEEERKMFTTDMYETPVHVCRMGFAGDIWPYFQPKFEIVEKYIRDNKLPYTSSMSFIPTGA